MPRRKLLPEAPPEDVELARSQLDNLFLKYISQPDNDPRFRLFKLGLVAEDQEDYPTAARCWAELANYVSPKLRSMEVNAKVQVAQVGFHVDLSGVAEDPE